MDDTAEEVADPNHEIARAVHVLTTALQEDPDYRRSWQANIAMAFFDEVRRDLIFTNEGSDMSKVTLDRLHGISNRAAEHFLAQICMDPEKPEAKGSFSGIMDQKRRTQVARDVQDERDRQETKWGQQNHDPFKYMAILMEEVGESSQAVIESYNFHFDSWDDEKLKHYREELIQTAAVAQAAVECIDRGHWYRRPEPSGG